MQVRSGRAGPVALGLRVASETRASRAVARRQDEADLKVAAVDGLQWDGSRAPQLDSAGLLR